MKNPHERGPVFSRDTSAKYPSAPVGKPLDGKTFADLIAGRRSEFWKADETTLCTALCI